MNNPPERLRDESAMASSLDSYLRGLFKDDGAFVERLTETIGEVIPMFSAKRVSAQTRGRNRIKVTTWPYAASLRESEDEPPKVSWSTHCMIAFALDAFMPRSEEKYSVLFGKRFRPPKLSTGNKNKLKSVVEEATTDVIRMVNRTAKRPLTDSGTYGWNDPFTLTWISEIVFRWEKRAEVTAEQMKICKGRLHQAVKETLARKEVLDTEGTEFNEVASSFLDVRRLHLALAAARLWPAKKFGRRTWVEKNTPDLWEKFDDTLHRQISYFAIKDQKFDPAELAFAFEGALLLHPNWVGRSTVEEVFDALKLSHDCHPFWRPLTPFLANTRGHVLFLISIEVANSILRSCEILDEKIGIPIHFRKVESHLRTYAMWLLGEKKEVRDKTTGENLVGWRTEYEPQRDIQLWHTSHVLVFLVHYSALLKRKIGAEAIEAAGLEVRKPKLIPGYWESEPLSSLSDPNKADGAERQYAVLRRIQRHYIEPREGNPTKTGKRGRGKGPRSPKASGLYSMLLYGPPGTGKTTVAEQIAARLGRPLLIVTVSDFLAAGAAEIENRAKGVFKVLNAQEHVIVLFDEIDQFLLDRNSDLYSAQDDIFKFMTPGMLTKLQDLRERENCIFVVATNYYERIDSAIKRRGRIDEHFLLSIPDERQRLRILETFVHDTLRKELGGPRKDKQYEIAAVSRSQKKFYRAIDSESFADEFGRAVRAGAKGGMGILAKTVLFGWGDLKNLVESKMKFGPGLDFRSLAEGLEKAVGEVDSAVSLNSYDLRFKVGGSHPFEEFLLLLYLIAETDRDLSREEEQAIQPILDIGDALSKSADFARRTRIKDETVYGRVSKYLGGYLKKRPASHP
jgi:ATPase family associated with various cellular activities (AAA)